MFPTGQTAQPSRELIFFQKISNEHSNCQEGSSTPPFIYGIFNNMNQIIAIRYIDAFYTKEKKLGSDKIIIHHTIGKLFATTKEFTAISFTEKNNIPWRGLLLPRESLIFDARKKTSELPNVGDKISKIKTNTSVGIFWKDIVYFENGIVPEFPPLMYTEGEVFSISTRAVIIQMPQTITITPKQITNHPEGQNDITLIIIPRSLITDIEIYD